MVKEENEVLFLWRFGLFRLGICRDKYFFKNNVCKDEVCLCLDD